MKTGPRKFQCLLAIVTTKDVVKLHCLKAPAKFPRITTGFTIWLHFIESRRRAGRTGEDPESATDASLSQ